MHILYMTIINHINHSHTVQSSSILSNPLIPLRHLQVHSLDHLPKPSVLHPDHHAGTPIDIVRSLMGKPGNTRSMLGGRQTDANGHSETGKGSAFGQLAPVTRPVPVHPLAPASGAERRMLPPASTPRRRGAGNVPLGRSTPGT